MLAGAIWLVVSDSMYLYEVADWEKNSIIRWLDFQIGHIHVLS